jgi:hypothetical protein
LFLCVAPASPGCPERATPLSGPAWQSGSPRTVMGHITTNICGRTARPSALADDKLTVPNRIRRKNMADAKVLSNQKTILSNQSTIVKNQKAILSNQQTIVKNQKTILSNQGAIKKNQSALSEILKNQKEILAAVKK